MILLIVEFIKHNTQLLLWWYQNELWL